MKTNHLILLSLTLLVIISQGCGKDPILQDALSRSEINHSEDRPEWKSIWPKVRFRYIYEFIEGCSGGECGACVGICVFWPVSLGGLPTSSELQNGIGRAKLTVVTNSIELVPLDLPMDPGTGNVIFDDSLHTESSVAAMLGFSKVSLLPGTYSVDYSLGDRYGRTIIPAHMVP